MPSCQLPSRRQLLASTAVLLVAGCSESSQGDENGDVNADEEDGSDETPAIQVPAIRGPAIEETSDGSRVEAVEIDVTSQSGQGPTPTAANPVDLTALTVEWIGATGSYELTHTDSSESEAGQQYAIKSGAEALEAGDTVATLVLDVGNPTRDGVDTSAIDALAPGSQARLEVTTAAGALASPSLTVPDTLNADGPIAIRDG